MSPMTMIESHHTVGDPILANPNDEEFGEEIAALFIAHANALRHAQGLSDLPNSICPLAFIIREA